MARKFRPNIYQKWTKAGVISITDQLHIQQMLFMATSKEGSRDTVKAYVDMNTALTLSKSILNGAFTKIWPSTGSASGYAVLGKFTSYGGMRSSDAYQGRPECRLFEIEAIKDNEAKPGQSPYRFIVSIRVGEGVRDERLGTIKPKDFSSMISQRFYFTFEEMYKMASVLETHITSYYSHNMENMYQEDGEAVKEAITDMYTTEVYKPKTKAVEASANNMSDNWDNDDIPV